MAAIVVSVLFLALAAVAAIVASRRKGRQHAIDMQNLVALRGRLDATPPSDTAPGMTGGDDPLGEDAPTDQSKE